MKKIIPIIILVASIAQNAHAKQFTASINVSCTIPIIVGVNYFPESKTELISSELALLTEQPVIDTLRENIVLDGQIINVETIIVR